MKKASALAYVSALVATAWLVRGDAAAAPSVNPRALPRGAQAGLDLSTLTLHRAGETIAGQAATPPKTAAAPVRGSLVLSKAERAALRKRLGALLSVDPASIVDPRAAKTLTAPGDTIPLGYTSPPEAHVVVETNDANIIYEAPLGPLHVRLEAGGWPALIITHDVAGGGVYLYTCAVDTNLKSIDLGVHERDDKDYSNGSGGFLVHVVGGKIFIPYETRENTRRLKLYIDFPNMKNGEYFEPECEITRVK